MEQSSSSGGLTEVPAHWDYNPHVAKVQWPVWLRQQYDGIDALNAAWGVKHQSFDEAEPVAVLMCSAPGPSIDRHVERIEQSGNDLLAVAFL